MHPEFKQWLEEQDYYFFHSSTKQTGHKQKYPICVTGPVSLVEIT